MRGRASRAADGDHPAPSIKLWNKTGVRTDIKTVFQDLHRTNSTVLRTQKNAFPRPVSHRDALISGPRSQVALNFKFSGSPPWTPLRELTGSLTRSWTWWVLHSVVVGTQWHTSGRVHRAKEMTTSSTVTRPTWRFPNQRDCRTGTGRCWTKPSLNVSSLTTRYQLWHSYL